jgi:hypothetical protein
MYLQSMGRDNFTSSLKRIGRFKHKMDSYNNLWTEFICHRTKTSDEL